MSASAQRDLLDPAVLARLGNLDVIARRVVEGAGLGLHRSPHFGFSQEFAEYRAYNEGDDTRFVDWNVFARTGRTFIKRFEGETSTHVSLLLDASASMNFGSPVTKLDLARFLLAALAWLFRQQQDVSGLLVFDEAVREHVEPSGAKVSFTRVLAALERTRASGETDVVGTLMEWHRRHSRRGMIILVSDLYCEPSEFARALQMLRAAGHEIGVFHVHDPEESSPSIKRISALADMESGEKIIVDPDFLGGVYRERFDQHRRALADAARHAGARFVSCSTTDPLDQSLLAWLGNRDTAIPESAR